jgi:hypothetical protein
MALNRQTRNKRFRGSFDWLQTPVHEFIVLSWLQYENDKICKWPLISVLAHQTRVQFYLLPCRFLVNDDLKGHVRQPMRRRERQEIQESLVLIHPIIPTELSRYR